MKNDTIFPQNGEKNPDDGSSVFFLNPRLMADAVAIVRKRQENFQDTESLFPGAKHPYALPLSKVQRFWLRKAGVPDVFLVDL